ncbi:ubiquinol oxidase subunit II [Alicyclobacillus ferrooxydans]|uniref:Quinol oxidase subunit 2 n=1 Tax=Alicyclobacillus ferrooxydans TaxID=471514 RepID=A0A0P9EIJ5_9BACL|nr:cytochrome C oxidase subunit II [Alicyclobacillus ferrooxydans]
MHKQSVKKWGALVTAVLAAALLSGCGPQYLVFHPVGPVGKQELNLIITSVILIAIVIVPTLAIFFFIIFRYRNTPGNKAKYSPEWSESKVLEVVWWSIPIIIVGILSVFTAKTTFALTRPPEQNVNPMTIEVTSLDWKWLFQYPGQGVATVNYCEIPTGVPVQFVLTSDAPMNSFWVPQLGGQEYTMPGMAMGLWLQADKPGQYYGHGANFTGRGFAHDDFTVIAASNSDFNKWVSQTKSSAPALTMADYNKLKKPSTMGTASYSSFPKGLFDNVIWSEGGRYMPGTMNMAGMASGNSTAMSNSTAKSGIANEASQSSSSNK